MSNPFTVLTIILIAQVYVEVITPNRNITQCQALPSNGRNPRDLWTYLRKKSQKLKAEVNGLREEFWNVVGSSDPKMFEETEGKEWVDPLQASWERGEDARTTGRTTISSHPCTTTTIMHRNETVQDMDRHHRSPSSTDTTTIQQIETTQSTISSNVVGSGPTIYPVINSNTMIRTTQQAQKTHSTNPNYPAQLTPNRNEISSTVDGETITSTYTSTTVL